MTAPDGSTFTNESPKLSFSVGKPGSGADFTETAARTHNTELVVKDGVGKITKTQVSGRNSFPCEQPAAAPAPKPPSLVYYLHVAGSVLTAAWMTLGLELMTTFLCTAGTQTTLRVLPCMGATGGGGGGGAEEASECPSTGPCMQCLSPNGRCARCPSEGCVSSTYKPQPSAPEASVCVFVAISRTPASIYLITPCTLSILSLLELTIRYVLRRGMCNCAKGFGGDASQRTCAKCDDGTVQPRAGVAWSKAICKPCRPGTIPNSSQTKCVRG
jgi:hypothetical protein